MAALYLAAAVIALQVGAGIAYLRVRDWRLALYWLLVAAVNAVVTNWRP